MQTLAASLVKKNTMRNTGRIDKPRERYPNEIMFDVEYVVKQMEAKIMTEYITKERRRKR